MDTDPSYNRTCFLFLHPKCEQVEIGYGALMQLLMEKRTLGFTQTRVSCAAILLQLINALVYIYTELYASRNGYLVIPKAAA